MGAATSAATSNPAGLIISSGVKTHGELSGSSTVKGRVKATAREIASVVQQGFRNQGWIN